MKLSLPRLFYVFLALGLAGCATPETLPSGLSAVVPAPSGAPASKTVELTIYRPRRLMGFGLRPTVRMNGKDLVTVPNAPEQATPFCCLARRSWHENTSARGRLSI